MTHQNSIRIVSYNEIAMIELDQQDSKVNKWSTGMMLRLNQVIDELEKSSYKAAIFISKKPKIFIAGADIDEIRSLKSVQEFDVAVKQGQTIFSRLEKLNMPVIAAMNGAVAGGGCEFALACDYRIATDDSSTRIGLPETKLGIIPGFGGCVRLPRALGLAGALDIILAGKLLNSNKAFKVGLVDQVVHPNILEKTALDFARTLIGKPKRIKRFQPKGLVNQILESPLGRGVIFSQAQKSVLKATHGHYPAPLKAIEVIKKTYGFSSIESALEIERKAFCEVAVTEVSKNLIHVFDLTEMVKKQTGVENSSISGMPIHHLGILGAGTMGGGVAYVAADKGIEVRMKDISFDAVAKGIKHARSLWEKLAKKRVINEFELQQRLAHVTGGVDFSDFKRTDLVVEAIVEDMEIKKRVFAELASFVRPDAIVVSNTSSLRVNEMQTAYPYPENFAGMHFFNPVDKMPLVEVIRGDKTSDQTIATVFELAKKMGKMPVVVKDGPGFLVNRLLLPYMAEAAFLLQEGQSIDFVDKAYVKHFGMPMGPFALMDEVGLDVCIKVLKIFKKAFGDRIEIAPFMQELETSGKLGKKNKNGFYQYDEKGYRKEVDQTIYSQFKIQIKNSLSEKECIERGIFAMVNECARAMVTDKIVNTSDEVDLAMIMGTGFPPFRGGLLKYADHYGVDQIQNALKGYSIKAPRLEPSPELGEIVKKGGFYKS